LDRFILTKLGKGNYEQGIEIAEKNKWLVGNGDHPALDYKVRVEPHQLIKKGDVVIIPPVKDKWILHKEIHITITSFHLELLQLLRDVNGNISDLLKTFFVLHNFGKRQNKGFGCFYPKEMDEIEFKTLAISNNANIFKYSNQLKFSPIQDNNPTSFYKTITKEWSRLKSGKNFNGYEKSRVFEYLEDKNFRWDKRWIKRKLKELIDDKTLPYGLRYNTDPIDINDRNIWNDTSNEEYRYGRALLGLAEHYEYQTTNSDYKYQVIVKSDVAERFKAPITFKIFNRSIYAIVENVFPEIYNKDFHFSIQQKEREGRDFVKKGNEINIPGTISTPANSEFDIVEFCNKYLPDINFNRI